MNEDLKLKLETLNPTTPLSHIQQVTHPFVEKLEFTKKKDSIKDNLCKSLRQTEYIYINDLKIPIESHKPFLTRTLYFCSKCLDLSLDSISLKRHESKCEEEIGILSYEEEIIEENLINFFKTEKIKIEIFQIDGCVFSKYSHALTKIGRFFFSDKSLDSLLEYFYFFVLKVNNQVVGYFSMDKLFKDCNISCIVIFPPYRQLKLSYLLIDYSYKIFQKRKLTATPERPFSAAGQAVFKKYWRFKINEIFKRSEELKQNENKIEIISKMTGIMQEDIKESLIDFTEINYKLKCLENDKIRILVPEKYEN